MSEVFDRFPDLLAFGFQPCFGKGFTIRAQNGQVRFRESNTEEAESRSQRFTPGSEKWETFWKRVELLDVWNWKSEYRAED